MGTSPLSKASDEPRLDLLLRWVEPKTYLTTQVVSSKDDVLVALGYPGPMSARPNRSFQNELCLTGYQLGGASAGSAVCLLISYLMTCGNALSRCCRFVRPGATGIPAGCRRMTVSRFGVSSMCCARV